MIDVLIAFLVVSGVINLVMFIPAFIFKTDKLTDISYGLSFLILSMIAVKLNNITTGKMILFFMILVWSTRISIYLFARILATKKDKRFDGIRENFLKFLSFWLLQGVSVWIILISSLMYISTDFYNLGILSLIGFIIWLAGISIEATSDYQQAMFFKNPKNKGSFISKGIWKYSRHPNYFGEMLCWIGIYVYVLDALSGIYALISLLSPAYIIFILVFVTGLPKVEKSADERFAKNKSYQKYKKTTSILIPWLPKK
ncbi:MAG: DUF1295 domain-containing protein [Candidatus Nanoarchaeia archaeon]|nr:DUF1295 domain-containing protein [Candidatus Nanoarchaeia archaeon]